MIIWCEDLYLDELAEKKEKKIKKKLSAGKPVAGLYCIALSDQPGDLFEIIHTEEFFFRYPKEKKRFVIGLCYGKSHAIDMVTKILLEILNATDDLDVRGYYKKEYALIKN